MRFIIYSKTAGTYLAANYGGQFFSGYESSTFTNKATTWPRSQAAQAYIEQAFDAGEDPNDLEVLAVNAATDSATMDECVAAGAAEWLHHILRLANDPDCYTRQPGKSPLDGLGEGLIVAPARTGMGVGLVIPQMLRMAAGSKVVAFDADTDPLSPITTLRDAQA